MNLSDDREILSLLNAYQLQFFYQQGILVLVEVSLVYLQWVGV
jgi:hypothetical protein